MFLWWIVKYVLIVYAIGFVVVFFIALFEKDHKFGSSPIETKLVVSLLPAFIWPAMLVLTIQEFIQEH